MGLKSSKSTGLDGISAKVLKLSVDVLSLPLCYIINTCIRSGIFPDKLKIAKVVPIFKKGSKSDPFNYRPISVLPSISKIFEKHVAIQLQSFIQRTNVIHCNQSGFRPRHSCQTALVNLVDSWANEISNKNIVGTLYLDLSKAFDYVNHSILLKKLKQYNFSNESILWFSSYLTNRCQLVQINNTRSSLRNIKTGVPQGSLLGPILFLFYINDLPLYLERCNTHLYADDGTLYCFSKSVDELEASLQLDLNNAVRWCDDNKMKLNVQKTTCMLIASNHILRNIRPLKLTCEGQNIICVTQQKVLGLLLNNDLKWNNQTQAVVNKVNNKLALLRRIKPFLNQEMRLLFYNAYIQPIYDFGIVLWHTVSKQCFKKVENTQKRAARMILNKNYDHPSKILFKELNWLPISSRCEYHISCITYKTLHNLTPTYLQNCIEFASNNNYNLRSESTFTLTTQLQKSYYSKLSLQSLCSSVWNNLPNDIKTAKSLTSFKYKLKLHLLNFNC